MPGWDVYSPIPPAPEPDPARCPRCGRMTAEYDREARAWRCYACPWQDRK